MEYPNMEQSNQDSNLHTLPFGKPIFSGSNSVNSNQPKQSNHSSFLRQKSEQPISNVHIQNMSYKVASPDFHDQDPYNDDHDYYHDDQDPFHDDQDPYYDQDPYNDDHDYYHDDEGPSYDDEDPYKDYQDPYKDYQDPYKDYQGPYKDYQDPYKDFQDPNYDFPPHFDYPEPNSDYPEPIYDESNPISDSIIPSHKIYYSKKSNNEASTSAHNFKNSVFAPQTMGYELPTPKISSQTHTHGLQKPVDKITTSGLNQHKPKNHLTVPKFAPKLGHSLTPTVTTHLAANNVTKPWIAPQMPAYNLPKTKIATSAGYNSLGLAGYNPPTSTNTNISVPNPYIVAPKTQFSTSMVDADCVNEMVFAAKKGKWETVWTILDKKPHIVNCIPKDRAWSALHQASYHNNIVAVQKLLSYPDCDPEIRTKQDKRAEHGPKRTPSDLATSPQVKFILTNRIQQRKLMAHYNSHSKPTLIEVSKFGKPLGSCIHLTLICCKGYLISNECDIEDIKISTLSQVMRLIFSYLNSGNNWIVAKDNVSLTLQQYSIELGNMLWTGDKKKGAESKELIQDFKRSFFIRTIKLYTGESKRLYKIVNDMLRNQSVGAHKPTSLELSLGPYALLLNSILMEWSALKPFQGTTYRSCSLSEEEAQTYQPGRQFAWLNFSSSSKTVRPPSNYLFVINNTFSLKWAPREIMQYSEYPQEQECLYAFGSMFRVTSFEKPARKIHLQLMDY